MQSKTINETLFIYFIKRMDGDIEVPALDDLPKRINDRRVIHAGFVLLFASNAVNALTCVMKQFNLYRFDNGYFPLIKTEQGFLDEKLDLTEVTSRYVAYWLYGPVCRLDHNYDKNLPIDPLEFKFLAVLFREFMHEKKYDYYKGFYWYSLYPDVCLILKLISDIADPKCHLAKDKNCGRKITRVQMLLFLVKLVNFNFGRVTVYLSDHMSYATNFTLDVFFSQKLSSYQLPIPAEEDRINLIKLINSRIKPWTIALNDQYMKIPGFNRDAKHLFLLSKRFPNWFHQDVLKSVMLPILYEIDRREYITRFRKFRVRCKEYRKSMADQERMIKSLFERNIIPHLDIREPEGKFRTDRVCIGDSNVIRDQYIGLEVGFENEPFFKNEYSQMALRQYYEWQKFTIEHVRRFLTYRNVVYDEAMNLKSLLELVVNDAFLNGVNGRHYNLNLDGIVFRY